jgi:NAD(P)-dependent dehydrogenase (short-subunit alcohol dehydrogenase family)
MAEAESSQESRGSGDTAFAGRVVIVTGAAGVVGRAVTEFFTARGARMALLDIASLEAPRHLAVQCELTDPEACRGAVRRIVDSLGRVDVLVNVAGGFAMGPRVHELSDDDWDAMMDVNVRTMLNMVRAVVPEMLGAGRGRIVNVGAGAGQRGIARLGAYSAAKSAVIRLTEALADELKADGVNVNCVLPSIIDTPRNRLDMPDADFSRWVKPAEIAAVIGFLASDAASAIHGAAVPVVGLV